MVKDFFALKAALKRDPKPDASRDTFAEDSLLAESHIARILEKESTYNKKGIAVK